MKNTFKLEIFLMLFVLCVCGTAWGQSYELKDNSNNSANTYGPAGSDMKKHISAEYIVTREEMASIGIPAGNISSISFKLASGSSSGRNITVYMAHTTLSSYSSLITSGLTRVASNKTINWMDNSGWTKIQFDNNFYYNGAQNLLIVIIDDKYEYYGQNINFYYRAVPEDRTLVANSNNPPMDLTETSFRPLSSPTPYQYMPWMKFEASVPACQTPQNVAIETLYSTSATIEWDEMGTATSWEILYGPSGFNCDNAGTLIQNVTTNPYTITGLTAGTDYDVYVRTAGSCTSAYSNLSFRTFNDCSNGGYPRRTLGEEYVCPNFLYCWAPTRSDAKYSYTQSIFTHEDVRVGGGIITGIDVYQIDDTDLEFSTSGTYKIYIKSTNLYRFTSDKRFIDISSSDEVFSNPAGFKLKKGWNHIEFNTAYNYDWQNNIVITFKTDRGTATSTNYKYLSVAGSARTLGKTNNYNPISVGEQYGEIISDAFPDVVFHVCEPGLFCSRPTITSVETNYGDATVTWTDGYDGVPGEYYIYYKMVSPRQLDEQMVTSTTNSITLHNIDCSSVYEVRVETECTNSVTSHSSEPVSFFACGPRSIPFYEDFESYPEACRLINCWHFAKYDGTSCEIRSEDLDLIGSINVSPTYVPEGQHGVYLQSWNSFQKPKYKMLITPELSVSSLSLCEVSYAIKTYSAASTGTVKIYVGVMSDPTDISTYTNVVDVTNKSYGYQVTSYNTVSLENYSGTGKYVAIKVVCDGYGNELSIDAIKVSFREPNCPPPSSFEGHLFDCGDGINLSWETPAALTNPTYTITRDGQTIVSSTSQTSYLDASASSGNHVYTIKAISPCETDEAVFTVYGINCCTGLAKPTLTVTEQGDRHVKVSWGNIAHASSYTLYYGINDPNTSTSNVWSVTNATSPFDALRLTNGETYKFAVMPVGTGDYCPTNPLSDTKSGEPNCGN